MFTWLQSLALENSVSCELVCEHCVYLSWRMMEKHCIGIWVCSGKYISSKRSPLWTASTRTHWVTVILHSILFVGYAFLFLHVQIHFIIAFKQDVNAVCNLGQDTLFDKTESDLFPMFQCRYISPLQKALFMLGARICTPPCGQCWALHLILRDNNLSISGQQ